MLDAAKEKVKGKLQSVPPIELDTYLQRTTVPIQFYEEARNLLRDIANDLSTEPEKLTFKEPFKNYVCVPVSTLELNDEQQKIFNCEFIEVYGWHFVDILEMFYGSKTWYEIWKSNSKMPKNEDTLIEFILEMTPEEFLCFFAPLNKSTSNQK